MANPCAWCGEQTDSLVSARRIFRNEFWNGCIMEGAHVSSKDLFFCNEQHRINYFWEP